MSTPSRFKKDKEIIAEYESQVKGKREGRVAAGRAPRRAGRPARPCPRLRPAEPGPAAAARRAVGPCCLNFGAAVEGRGEGAAGAAPPHTLRAAPVCVRGRRGLGGSCGRCPLPGPGRVPSLPPPTSVTLERGGLEK